MKQQIVTREDVIQYARQYYEQHGIAPQRDDLENVVMPWRSFRKEFKNGIDEILNELGIVSRSKQILENGRIKKTCAVCHKPFKTKIHTRETCSQWCSNIHPRLTMLWKKYVPEYTNNVKHGHPFKLSN